MKLPEVWQPDPVVRELRRLFGMYELLNRQLRQLKNEIHGVLLNNGIRDRTLGDTLVATPANPQELLGKMDLSVASEACIRTSLDLLPNLDEKKEAEIYQAGKPLKAQVKLLLSIRGITPLLALAFLRGGRHQTFPQRPKATFVFGGGTDRALKRRGHSQRDDEPAQPTSFANFVHSGGEPFYRLFARTEAFLSRVGCNGYGRARIAVLRKIFSMTRRMLFDR